MFTLKLYDTPLLTFTVDYDTLRGELTPRIHWVTEQRELLPCILQREHCDPRALMCWLNTRRPPRNREYASELYKQAGLAEDDLNGFLTVTKGLSVEDAYWTPGIHDTVRRCESLRPQHEWNTITGGLHRKKRIPKWNCVRSLQRVVNRWNFS